MFNWADRTGLTLQKRITKNGGQPVGRSPQFSVESLEGRSMLAATSLITPSALAVTSVEAKAVTLAWADNDRAAAGYYVLRAEGTGAFTRVATINSRTTLSFTDRTANSNRGYRYEVQAFAGSYVSAVSSIVSATTLLAAPSGLTAAATGLTAVQLRWIDNDSGATGYKIFRSTDGLNFAQLSSVSGVAANSFIDSTVVSGSAYTYMVQAVSTSNSSARTAGARAVTPLAAPTSVLVTPAARSVSISWSGLDAHARNYVVSRSTDGTNFTVIATLSNLANNYLDSSVATGTNYFYRVAATNTVSPAATSAAVRTTTLLVAPTSLAATLSGTKINLTWADSNRAGMGYIILRSSDGANFTQLAVLAANSAKSYSDTTVATNQTYSYKVQAKVDALVSEVSNVATVSSATGTDTVSITTRYSNEMVITSTGAGDRISVSQSGSALTLNINGQIFTRQALAAGLFIYDRGGSDVIVIDTSVTVRTTIVSLGSGIANINDANNNSSIWIDSDDVFTGRGSVHRIGSFSGGVSKALGAALANPSDSGRTAKLEESLWGTAPSPNDVNQGGVGDCYFLASLAAFANTNPGTLQNLAVDLGDGTFAVQFTRASQSFFVRVSNDIPQGAYWGYQFARPGTNATMWAVVMEKAYASFRTGANTYASLNAGWMGAVYNDLGVSSISFGLTSSEANFFSMVSGDLANGRPVTFGTSGSAPSLVRGHAYTLISATRDASGVTRYVVRNPWGVSGNSMENSSGYATLTYAQMQANFAAGARAA